MAGEMVKKFKKLLVKEGRVMIMYKASKLLVCGLMLSFLVAGIAGAEQTFNSDANAPFKAAWGYLTGNAKKWAEDGYMDSLLVKDGVGGYQLQASRNGTYRRMSAKKETDTVMWDEDGTEISVGYTVYLGGWKLFSYSPMIDESGQVTIGSMITVYEYDQAVCAIKIETNIADATAISDLLQELFFESELPTDTFSLDTATWDIKIAKIDANGNVIPGQYNTIRVTEFDVKKQAEGLLSNRFLVSKLVGQQDADSQIAGIIIDLIGVDNAVEVLKGYFKTIAAELKEKYLKDTDYTKEELTDYLKGKLNEGTGVADVADGVFEEILTYERDRKGSEGSESSAIMDNKIKALLRNAIKKTIASNYFDKLEPQEMLDNLYYYQKNGTRTQGHEGLVKNILLTARVEVPDVETGEIVTKFAYELLPERLEIADSTETRVQNLSQTVDHLGLLCEGINREGLPDFTVDQIRSIIAAVQSGTPLVYIGETGNIETYSTQGTGDDRWRATAKDEAFAKAYITSITFSAQDLVKGPDWVKAKFNELYGEFEYLLDQGYLENNPLKLAMLCTTTINGEEFLIIDLPENGLEGVTSSYAHKKKLYTDLGQGKKPVLNAEITDDDFRKSRDAYIELLCQTALEQGILVGEQEAVTISVGLSDGYKNDLIDKRRDKQFYSGGDIDAIIDEICHEPTISKLAEEALRNLTMPEKRRVVNLLLTASEEYAVNTNVTEFAFDLDGDEVVEAGEVFKFSIENDPATPDVNETQAGSVVTFGGAFQVYLEKEGNRHPDEGNGDWNQDNFRMWTKAKAPDGKPDNNDVWAATRHIRTKEAIVRDGVDHFNEANLQPIVGAFSIGSIAINGSLAVLNLSGYDPTSLLPNASVPLQGLSTDVIDDWMWGDPAVMGMVLGVYDSYPIDANGNLNAASLTAADLSNQGLDTAWIVVEQDIKADDFGNVFIHAGFWNTLTSEQQQQVINHHAATGAQQGGELLLYNMEKDSSGRSIEAHYRVEEAASINVSEEKQAVVIEAELVALNDAGRTKVVAELQKCLIDPINNPLTMYGLMEGTDMLALGLGFGPFEAFPWDIIVK